MKPEKDEDSLSFTEFLFTPNKEECNRIVGNSIHPIEGMFDTHYSKIKKSNDCYLTLSDFTQQKYHLFGLLVTTAKRKALISLFKLLMLDLITQKQDRLTYTKILRANTDELTADKIKILVEILQTRQNQQPYDQKAWDNIVLATIQCSRSDFLHIANFLLTALEQLSTAYTQNDHRLEISLFEYKNLPIALQNFLNKRSYELFFKELKKRNHNFGEIFSATSKVENFTNQISILKFFSENPLDVYKYVNIFNIFKRCKKKLSLDEYQSLFSQPGVLFIKKEIADEIILTARFRHLNHYEICQAIQKLLASVGTPVIEKPNENHYSNLDSVKLLMQNTIFENHLTSRQIQRYNLQLYKFAMDKKYLIEFLNNNIYDLRYFLQPRMRGIFFLVLTSHGDPEVFSTIENILKLEFNLTDFFFAYESDHNDKKDDFQRILSHFMTCRKIEVICNTLLALLQASCDFSRYFLYTTYSSSILIRIKEGSNEIVEKATDILIKHNDFFISLALTAEFNPLSPFAQTECHKFKLDFKYSEFKNTCNQHPYLVSPITKRFLESKALLIPAIKLLLEKEPWQSVKNNSASAENIDMESPEAIRKLHL